MNNQTGQKIYTINACRVRRLLKIATKIGRRQIATIALKAVERDNLATDQELYRRFV